MNMPLNISIKKELLILVMGPVFQNIAYLILTILIKDNDLVTRYHIGILVFNLLPIYPLDGGKILNIFFNSIIPYRKSYRVVIIISYLINIIILFSNHNLSINMIITYLVLIIIIRKEQLKEDILYNKFLLERYLYNYNYKHDKIITNIDEFYRTKNNILKKNNVYYTEKDILNKKYHYFEKKY